MQDMTPEAFEALARDHARRLWVVAWRMLADREDARDAVQRALASCFAGRASYNPAWAPSTWLYRALANTCVDELRRRARRPTLPLEAADGVAAPAGPDLAARVDLERALARVPPEARLLLALRHVDGLSLQELARVRGISVNTVKSQLARGKAIVRRALDMGGRDGRARPRAR